MEFQQQHSKLICCNKTFVFEETMNIHKDVMHSDPTITKPTCSPNKNKLIRLKVKSKKLLCSYANCSATHKSLENHHKIRYLQIDVKKKEICPECGKVVKKLVDHQKRTHTGSIFQCQKCPHTTKDSYELKRHFKRVHTESFQQPCQFCGKVFKQIKRHLQSTMCGNDVDNRKMLQCQTCEIKCLEKSSLQKHIKNIHYKVKDKTCQHCSYQTYITSNLRLHVSNVHEKTSMFKYCQHCEMRTGNIELHIATYHSEQTV